MDPEFLNLFTGKKGFLYRLNEYYIRLMLSTAYCDQSSKIPLLNISK